MLAYSICSVTRAYFPVPNSKNREVNTILVCNMNLISVNIIFHCVENTNQIINKIHDT